MFCDLSLYLTVLRAGGVLPICPIWVPMDQKLDKSGTSGVQNSFTKPIYAAEIYSIQSFVELSGHAVVQRHINLPICPIWTCPWAENLSNQVPLGSRLCGTHIPETAWWIYTIRRSAELAKPVVVQHHRLMTFTLDFQGQMLEIKRIKGMGGPMDTER